MDLKLDMGAQIRHVRLTELDIHINWFIVLSLKIVFSTSKSYSLDCVC